MQFAIPSSILSEVVGIVVVGMNATGGRALSARSRGCSGTFQQREELYPFEKLRA